MKKNRQDDGSGLKMEEKFGQNYTETANNK